MPETLVLCGGEKAKRSHGRIIELDVDPYAPPTRRIDFESSRLSAPLLDDLPDALADALELAAYVYCADRSEPRHTSDSSADIGTGWQRQFRFQIPVRRPDLWRRAEVKSALVDVLSFLSGDVFSFDFTSADKPVSVEPFLGFGDQNAQVIRPQKVILFSGGLDSLAGVSQEVIDLGGSAILVTHQSATQIMALQDELARRIDALAPGRSFYAPVRVRRGADMSREHTQRLRSFLFATLGVSYAHMFGLRSVHFFENGITSFNLPVAEHVIGTRASRTTHPRVLSLYSKLFSLLLSETLVFENELLWHTKADVVRTIDKHGCSNLISLTTSCANVRNYSMTGLQCGACSQCIERRVAMIAAGVEGRESPYEKDIILGPIEGGCDLTMIEGHFLRANRMRTMSQHAFLSNYGQLARAFGDMAAEPAEAAEQTYRLHRRYGTEFVEVVNEQLAAHANVDKMRLISPASLLGMLLPRVEPSAPYIDCAEKEPPASVQAEQPAIENLRTRTIVLAVDRERKRIEFADGPALSGNPYRILVVLIDCAATPGGEQFVPTERLARQLGMSTENVRQAIDRFRRKLGKEFKQATGFATSEHDVIETLWWRGYRLNPSVLVVPIEKLPRNAMSRASHSGVTTKYIAH